MRSRAALAAACLGNSVKVRAVEPGARPHRGAVVGLRSLRLAGAVIVVSDLQLENAMNPQVRGCSPVPTICPPPFR